VSCRLLDVTLLGTTARIALAHVVRWTLLGAAVGALAGLSSAAFLESLSWVTNTRLEHGWLLYLLPLAGLVIGLAAHRFGGRAAGGTVLIIDEIHQPTAWVPRRMAPMVFGGTVVTHLFGGSAGREGTALQMSGSVTDGFSRLLKLRPADRRTMLIAALAGGFGAVFGVPIAGCIFGIEVRSGSRLRVGALVPSLTASIVGDRVVRGLGVQHTPLPDLGTVHLTAGLVAKVVVAGIAFGLVSRAFVIAAHRTRRLFAASVGWPPLLATTWVCRSR
jgi:H+/Cl- antiporter ClcA